MTSWGSTYFFHFCGQVSSKYWLLLRMWAELILLAAYFPTHDLIYRYLIFIFSYLFFFISLLGTLHFNNIQVYCLQKLLTAYIIFLFSMLQIFNIYF